MEIDLFFDVILLLKDKVNNICLLVLFFNNKVILRSRFVFIRYIYISI